MARKGLVTGTGRSYSHPISSQEVESELEMGLGYETSKAVPVSYFLQQDSISQRSSSLLRQLHQQGHQVLTWVCDPVGTPHIQSSVPSPSQEPQPAPKAPEASA